MAVDALGHRLGLEVTSAAEEGFGPCVVKLGEVKNGFVLLPPHWGIERSFLARWLASVDFTVTINGWPRR